MYMSVETGVSRENPCSYRLHNSDIIVCYDCTCKKQTVGMGFNCIVMDLETKQSNLSRVPKSVFYLLGALLVAGSNGCISSAEK